MGGILLAGLTDHEAAAIDILIGMHWRAHRSVILPRSLSLAIPDQGVAGRACESCVIDLFGLGMRKHSREREAELLAFLGGRSAVLLTWGDGGGWLECGLRTTAGQQLVWIGMPYTSASLREGLKRVLAAGGGQRAPLAAAVAHTVTPAAEPATVTQRAAQMAAAAPAPAWKQVMALAERSAPSPRPAVRAAPADGSAPVAPPAPLVTLPAGAVGLTRGALPALLQAFPLLEAQPLVELTRKIVSGQGPQLLRLGADIAFVTDARQGWLASGLSVPALLKMLRAPSLLDEVEIEALPADAVEETVRQRFGGRFFRAHKSLDVITWELMSDMLRSMSLRIRGDLALQLRHFPNFTLLAGVGPLDVQLASICVRMPQTVSELRRAFPKHEQAVLRFAVLSVLSGAAVVLPAGQPATVAAAVPAVPAKPQQGFFRSLLDKLF